MTSWRQIQKQNFTDWKKLAAFLEIDEHAILTNTSFPLNLPLRLAQKIQKNNLNDPILRQFLPTPKELEAAPGYRADAVGDGPARKERKLLHKYKGRALLVCTSACAMNCRFCFRQKFPYETEEKSFDRELEAIANDDSLTEIILSGGDPLSLSDRTLQHLISKLDKIPHLKRLRFHSRFPIGIPERIDASFLNVLKSTRLQIFFLVHCNHPHELDDAVAAALKKIQLLGIPVLNQGVLLKGVNDSLPVLKALVEKLVDNGIVPYYLNQLDRVQGTAHFEVAEEQGLKLLKELSKEVSGYAIPRYVREIPGMPSKTALLQR